MKREPSVKYVCVCVCLSVCRETRVVLSCVEQMMKMLRTKRTWRGIEATQHQRHNSLGAKYGRYCYPGKKVIDVDDVPDSIRRKLPTTTEKYIIHWYTENNYSAIKKHKVELFTKNLIDQARAEQSPSIQEN